MSIKMLARNSNKCKIKAFKKKNTLPIGRNIKYIQKKLHLIQHFILIANYTVWGNTDLHKMHLKYRN